MKLPFSLTLALRYLRPKRTSVSVISMISVLGVTLGITVLVVVIAVMTGFHRELTRVILGFEPHLRLTNGQVLNDWQDLADEVAKTPDVVAVAPYVQGPVLAVSGDQISTPIIRGIDPERERKLIDYPKFVVDGVADLESDTVLVGEALAMEMGVVVGSKITLYAPSIMEGLMSELKQTTEDTTGQAKTLKQLREEIVLPPELTVVGIFRTGRHLYDSSIMLMPLHNAQELYALSGGVHGLAVQGTNPDNASLLQAEFGRRFGDRAWANTWFDTSRDRLEAVAFERTLMFIILMCLIVIAAFGITSTLITVTVQKTREIGILKALGATTSQIIWVFLGQGIVVGLAGNVIGVALGLGILAVRNPFKEWLSDALHIQLFPSTIYELREIPAEIIGTDIAKICIWAFLICALAALIPAWNAARLDPVKALRRE